MRVVIILLGPMSPSASSDATRRLGRDHPQRLPIWSCFGWGLPCDRRYRRPGELLPHPFTLAARPFDGEAVCFLWHFPSRHRDWALPSTLPYGARTFLSPGCRKTASTGQRSFDLLYSHRIKRYVSLSPPCRPRSMASFANRSAC